jgi:hypothetical protein
MSLVAPMVEAARTSETSVDIQFITRQYIPEDSELQISFVICLNALIDCPLLASFLLVNLRLAVCDSQVIPTDERNLHSRFAENVL